MDTTSYTIKLREVELFLDIAERAAQMSRATKLKVGAVIVKDGRILSLSWNGTPRGWDNECEYKHYSLVKYDYLDEDGSSYELKTKPEVMHAEANSILKLARDGESGKDATLFCTHAPCIDCAKMIFGAGINKVFYRDTYKDDLGLKFLEKCGVEVVNSYK